MHRFTLTTLFCLCLALVRAQGFIFLGAGQTDDQGNRMIVTQDGSYITVGSAGSNAVIYRTNCLGNLEAKLEKQLLEGPAVFYDVIELADGNILAVGKVASAIPPASDRVFLLKATPALTEVLSSFFYIDNEGASAKSVAQSGTGEALLWGERAGIAPNYYDAFVQKIDLSTLQSVGNPVLYNDGIDFAARIIPTTDGGFLLTGNSVAGDIFNPNALLANAIQVYKVDKNGALLWHSAVRDTFSSKYGYAQACGAVQAAQTGHFIIGSNTLNPSVNKQNPFFIAIDNDGLVLDTIFTDAPENQLAHAIVENMAYPGLFAMIGDSEGSPFNSPAFMLSQAYEFAGQLIATGPTVIDLNNPVSLRDAAQVDPGRFAIMGTYPEAPGSSSPFTQVVITTPAVAAGIVYQNCALAVTLSGNAVAYQWVLEGVAISGATQGVYFPTEPGLYQVQVLDTKGCYGISDTFRVNAAQADFSYTLDNLTATFSNLSSFATQYQWDFGDGATSTQANPVHTYAADGIYEVTLIAKTACPGNFSDTLTLPVGVVSASEPNVIRYSMAPNPTSGISTLEVYFSSGQNAQYTLSSPLGQVIAQEALPIQNGRLIKQIDLSAWPAGIYPLRISNGSQVIIEKMVKY